MTAPLTVVALGGNAISPPHGDLSTTTERALIDRAVAEVAALAAGGVRLLLVHGNGPQVGRLMAVHSDGGADLDLHVAQTQGELGYLLAEGLDARLGDGAAVAVVTRVLVDANDPAFAHPTKPIGAVLDEPPAGVPAVRVAGGAGWRRVVASPRPIAVVERDAIGALLATHHVIAGGGGGVALVGTPVARQAKPAVVDKDWVAALLAMTFNAAHLVFVTDVSHAFDRFGERESQPITVLRAGEARQRLAAGVFAPGSMAPKIESAVQFAEGTGREAVITTIGLVAAAVRGKSGTVVRP